MKRGIYFILIVLLVIVSACSIVSYTQAYKYDDEFRGGTRNYSRISIKPEESRMEVGEANIIIEKEEKGSIKNVKAYFAISRSTSSFNVDKTGYIKVGDQKFELNLLDQVSGLRTRNEASVSSFSSSDSTGVKTGQSADIETEAWNEDKFIIEISSEIIAHIKQSQEVIFRFYFGPIPVTYRIKGWNLQLVKEVL